MPRLYAIGIALLLAGGGCGVRCQSTAAPRIRARSNSNCGRLIRYVRPVYPEEAKRQHIQGIVKLRVVISVKGEPRNIDVREGDPVFVPAALRAVKQWRFTPCLLNGDAIEVVTEVEVPFTLAQ